MPDDDARSDEEEEDDDPAASGFDFAALEEAQRLAASAGGVAAALTAAGSGSKRKRGGCKDARKRRKKERRDDDVLKAVQAGLIPRLRDALDRSTAATAATPSTTTDKAQGQMDGCEVADASAVASGPPAVAAADLAAEPATAGALPSKAQLRRAIVSYADSVEDSLADDGRERPPEQHSGLAKRVTKDIQRRQKEAKIVGAKTVFVTNLAKTVSEDELRKMLGQYGDVKSARLSRDRETTKFLGYAHAQFETAEQAQEAIKQCDKSELKGREIRVASSEAGKKIDFELPAEIRESFVDLIRERYEGKNLSCIRDAWQKRRPGQKLDVTRWGFKRFWMALKSIDGIVLESHAEKTMTMLAFFPGSDAHQAFLKQKAELLQAREREANERAAACAAVDAARKQAAVEASTIIQGGCQKDDLPGGADVDKVVKEKEDVSAKTDVGPQEQQPAA